MSCRPSSANSTSLQQSLTFTLAHMLSMPSFKTSSEQLSRSPDFSAKTARRIRKPPKRRATAVTDTCCHPPSASFLPFTFYICPLSFLPRSTAGMSHCRFYMIVHTILWDRTVPSRNTVTAPEEESPTPTPPALAQIHHCDGKKNRRQTLSTPRVLETHKGGLLQTRHATGIPWPCHSRQPAVSCWFSSLHREKAEPSMQLVPTRLHSLGSCLVLAAASILATDPVKWVTENDWPPRLRHP